MPEKKRTNNKNAPEHTIRCGSITASIFHRQSNAGYTYLDFQIGRVFVNRSTNREVHGNAFYENNEQDLIQTVQEACAWIRCRLYPALPRQECAADQGLVQ
jgi:hypothetical protein